MKSNRATTGTIAVQPAPSSLRPLILGTAGHIDHGKTSLVKALTGIDADRLPEEQARGMTIDLGFAHMEAAGRRVGIVDVPGHERFIRNMVAGATGIDLVMLVIAADDAVMPQTREHMEIIDVLGVAGGLIALNKVDLVDEPLIQRAETAAAELVRGTALEGCPIVRVSAATGEGIETLREAIAAQIRKTRFAPWPPLFRLPIDRRFTIQGHGTVVTGSLIGGDVTASEEAELLPQRRRVRVRSAQSHGGEHRGLESGRRVAVNLAGVRTSEIERGNELAAVGYIEPTRRIAVRLRCLNSSPLALGSREVLRLHIGTQSVDARVALIGRESLDPGENAAAILQMEEEICAAHGQRFIVRSNPHAMTVGGGIVICACPPKAKLSDAAPTWFTALESGTATERLLAILEIEPRLGGNLRALYRETGVTPDEAEPLLRELAKAGKILRSPGPKDSGFWTESYVRHCKAEILARIQGILEKTRPRASVEAAALARATSALGPPEFVDWLLKELEAEGKIAASASGFVLSGYTPQLRESELADQKRLIAVYEKARFAPPTLEEAAARAGLTMAKAEPLLAHALDTGQIISINAEFGLSAASLRELLDLLRHNLAASRGLTVSQIKDILGVSRKYAVPICEFLDRRGFTRRQGDERFAGPKLGDP